MSRSQPSLEVTRSLLECAKANGFQFGADTALVAVQHMLYQTVDLFRTVSEMGLGLNNIFALGKVYSNSFPVMATLREMGVTVIDSTLPKPGEFHRYFQNDVDRLWETAVASLAKRPVKRVIVLDDAGACIASVPPEVLRRYAVCGVEQTSSGMFLFEREPPPFAVISWARAAVKLETLGPIFSQYFIEKLNTEFLQGESLEGKRLGIIGLGSMGRGVADLLFRQGNEVLFYDSDPALHVPESLLDKITRLHSLEELMLHCDYVLGCSGRNPFRDKWPMNHRAGIKLVSASSGDQEFGPIIRELTQKSDFKVASDTWDIVSEHGPSGPIHVAYLGYPYSFVSRDTEALPTQIVQLDTGGLLAALVQARLFLELCETGGEQNRGLHRLSPKAQRFVYDRWAKAMQDRLMDITHRYGFDSDLLRSMQHDDWFFENTEPHPDEHYSPVKSIETLLDSFCWSPAIAARD